MGYTNYWNQCKIKVISDELIDDIKKLFKYIYGDHFDKVYLINDDHKNDDDEYYEDKGCYIHKLDSNGIIIETPCEWFVIDVNRDGFNFCKTYGRYYDYIVKCLIMLSVYHKVIDNNWSDDDYCNINYCKDVLNKIGYTTFNCEYNIENGRPTYHLSMSK